MGEEEEEDACWQEIHGLQVGLSLKLFQQI
jgi:hypothetical protein